MQAASTIRNREFTFDPSAPIEVLRAGEFPHSSGVTQVVDSLALESVLANFAKDKQSPNFPGLLVDFDHFSADMDKPSEAAGWIQELRREGNSLLAVVDWTGAGDQAIRSGRYRLLSPVFNREEMQDLGNGRLRPVRLDSAGLTNSPNMRGLTPISNRSEPENVATLTPQQAGARCLALANRFKAEHGGSFDAAWHHVRSEAPALFNRMTPERETPRLRDQGRLLNREQRDARRAADRILELARSEMQARAIPFDRAWQQTCASFPDLNAKAAGRVFNRAEAESTADFERAEKRSREVLRSLEQHLDKMAHPDRGEIITNDAALRGAFLRTMSQLQREESLTLEQAYEHIKSTEPVFWQRFVLLFEGQAS